MWAASLLAVLAAASSPAQEGNVLRDAAVDPIYAEAGPEELLLCPAGTTPRMTEDQLRERLEAWYGDLVDQDISAAVDPILREAPRELRYPRRALRAYGSGHVVVLILIEKDGSVPEALVTCSSDPLYESSAVEFALGYRFAPSTLHGQPIRSLVRQPVEFGTP